MEIEKKEAADMNDAPPSDPKNCLYNCSECSSNIEIISLDENNIEFICNNKHNIKIEIKEYLNKMKQYNKIKLNDDKCDVHKKEYLSYCFDCNNHLCKDCLKTGNHKYHYKINIIEILPEDEILDKIRSLIQKNIIKINKLKKDKTKTEERLSNILNKNIEKIKSIKNENKEKNNKKEEDELKVNKREYESKIKKLKEEYDNKIKEIKNEENLQIKEEKDIKKKENENIMDDETNNENLEKEKREGININIENNLAKEKIIKLDNFTLQP